MRGIDSGNFYTHPLSKASHYSLQSYPQNLSLRSYKNLSTTIKYILPKKRNLSVKRRKKAVNLFLFPLQLAVSAEPCV